MEIISYFVEFYQNKYKKVIYEFDTDTYEITQDNDIFACINSQYIQFDLSLDEIINIVIMLSLLDWNSIKHVY